MNNTNQINQTVIENYCVDVEKENELLKAKLLKAEKELVELRSEKLYREKDLEHYINLVEIKDKTIKGYHNSLFKKY
tara:strand:+ start:4212 stop:4442 length:231 start_codon:yes stop_codon:yes gene_type:complete